MMEEIFAEGLNAFKEAENRAALEEDWFLLELQTLDNEEHWRKRLVSWKPRFRRSPALRDGHWVLTFVEKDIEDKYRRIVHTVHVSENSWYIKVRYGFMQSPSGRHPPTYTKNKPAQQRLWNLLQTMDEEGLLPQGEV